MKIQEMMKELRNSGFEVVELPDKKVVVRGNGFVNGEVIWTERELREQFN